MIENFQSLAQNRPINQNQVFLLSLNKKHSYNGFIIKGVKGIKVRVQAFLR